MAEVTTTIAAGAAASAASAASSGMPPSDVVAWALIGGLVAVWLEHQAELIITARWAIGAIARALVSAAAGVALSAVALALAPTLPGLSALAQVPQWAMAGIVAALIHRIGPKLFDAASSWLTRGGANGRPS